MIFPNPCRVLLAPSEFKFLVPSGPKPVQNPLVFSAWWFLFASRNSAPGIRVEQALRALSGPPSGTAETTWLGFRNRDRKLLGSATPNPV
jgi:hypothetical protein